MVDHIAIASELLYGPGGLGITNIKIFRGTNPNTTADQLAEAIVKSIERISAGDYDLLSDDID